MFKRRNMGENYIKGLYRTNMIARLMEPISEKQIDAFKEGITRYCEWKIDSSPLSFQEKEDQKRQMKQSADAYNHGIKDGLRMNGRLR